VYRFPTLVMYGVIWIWIENGETWIELLGCVVVLFEVIFGTVMWRGSSGYIYIHVSWLSMCIRRVFRLILVLWHTNMRCLFMAQCNAYSWGRLWRLIVKLRCISMNIKVNGLIIVYNVYKHECNHIWVEMQHWSLNMCKRILCDNNQL